MINELIEKEIDKVAKNLVYGFVNFVQLRQSLKNIAKEVAIRFKEENWNPKDDYDRGYTLRITENNNLADQIINEVSK